MNNLLTSPTDGNTTGITSPARTQFGTNKLTGPDGTGWSPAQPAPAAYRAGMPQQAPCGCNDKKMPPPQPLNPLPAAVQQFYNKGYMNK